MVVSETLRKHQLLIDEMEEQERRDRAEAAARFVTEGSAISA